MGVGDDRTVLLTGATGFVGRHLFPALVAAGWRVRCATRNPERARAEQPDREWVRLDVADEASVRQALEGCEAAYYLVHGMGGGGDYPDREASAARTFREMASGAGLRRLVYLGGVAPSGEPSRHLRSRLETGRLLRAGRVPTVELRAAMIIGPGSESWHIVRDLAARLPAMVLPKWLSHTSCPVHVDDVVRALVHAADMPVEGSCWLDVPGPESLSHRELLRRVAGAMLKRPPLFDVPVLTPRLSSYWIALITRADLRLAQELVEGLRSNLEPTGPSIWEELEPGPMPLAEAIRRALAAEHHANVA